MAFTPLTIGNQKGAPTVSFQPYVAPTVQKKGFLAEAGEDIQQIGVGIRDDISRRVDKTQEIERAQAAGEQGLARSLFQRFGQGAGAASDVVGRLFTGAVKVALPQSAEERVKGAIETGVRAASQLEPVQEVMTKYEQLKETNPALARDIESALGLGTLALDIGTAGAGGRAVNLGIKGVDRAAELATRTVGKAGGLGRRVVFEIEGALTGTSQETLEEAFRAARAGGRQLDDLTANLRGQVTPEQLVENVRAATDIIDQRKTADFRDALKGITKETVDTSAVRPAVETKLAQFGITPTETGLDFTNSKFRLNPQAQTKIEQAYQEVVRLGSSKTLGQVDTTRQVLRELTLAGDDSASRSANAIINQTIDSVRGAGKQVKGYEDLLGKFAEDAEFLTELRRSLSTGDKATIDTAYRKLATSLKTNNERRMNLLRQLDEATDGALLGSISGQQLSETLPRGLFRQIAAGMAGVGVVTGGIPVTSVFPALIFASPRVAGEFVRALGLGAQKTQIILDAIMDAQKIVENLRVPVPIVSPTLEAADIDEPEIPPSGRAQ